MKIRFSVPFITIAAVLFLSKSSFGIILPDTTFAFQDFSVQKVWEIQNDSSSTKVLISNNKIFYTLDNGVIYCYDLNGKEKWIAEAFGNIKKNSVQYKDLFLAVTVVGDLYSINANNSDVVQVIGVGENISTDLALIDIINSGYQSKGVIFGTEEGNVYCYDIFTFEILWQANLSPKSLINEPLVLNDKIIIQDSSSSIYCINSKSGLLIWKYNFNKKNETQNTTSLLSDGKTIYCVSPDEEVTAIDLMLGKKLWQTKSLDVYSKIFFNSTKEELLLLNKKSEIISLSAKDGKETKKLKLEKENINNFSVTDFDNQLLLALSDGSIYLVDDTFNPKLISINNDSEITSIKKLSENKFITSSKSGKIAVYKLN